MGAPLGNKNATIGMRSREWSDAIRRAVARRKKLKQRGNLNDLADALIDSVLEKDVSAIKEFGDRYDGKPAQIIQGPGDEGEHTVITRIEEVIVDPQR